MSTSTVGGRGVGSGLRILAAHGDRAIARLLARSLPAQGWAVFLARSADEALAAALHVRPDLVLLDLDLPRVGGIEVTRRLREWTSIPVIILSSREEEAAKIAALDAGADDYLSEPFGIGELAARIRVAMRHAVPRPEQPAFALGDLSIDFAGRSVRLRGREVSLTPTEYDLLRVLVQHAGQVLTHEQLLLRVWGKTRRANVHLLQATVSNLRHKIEPDPSRPAYLLCQNRVGYRLRAPR